MSLLRRVGRPPAAYSDDTTGPVTSAWAHTTQFDPSTDTQWLELAPPGPLGQARWMGQRLRLLVLAALIGSVGLFLVARWVAMSPHLDADWTRDDVGRIVLSRTSNPALQPQQGSTLLSIADATGVPHPVDALALERSPRWLVTDAERQRHVQLRSDLGALLEAPQLLLRFPDETVRVTPKPRGYAALGVVFWMTAGLALVLYLIAMVVLLARPTLRNLLYAAAAVSESLTLLCIAIEYSLDLGLPAGFAAWNAPLRSVFDMITSAALLHAVALHPTRLPGARWIGAASWAAAGLLSIGFLSSALPHAWWWAQGSMIGAGALAIVLLQWSYSLEPHPFTILMQRFGGAALGSLVLLTLGIAAVDAQSFRQHTIASIGSVVWHVFFVLLMLMVPMMSRAQQVVREFSLLAGVSTVATSLDLLFVAAFSFSPFASLTLSLFVALALYAGARQWLLNQLLGNRLLTTERMFALLYRVAREVERRPESLPEHMSRMLRELFEPIEMVQADRAIRHARVMHHGSTLCVPVPDLSPPRPEDPPAPGRTLVLRFANRGRRLFTLEDARLTDRILHQLRRAVAYDQAVEQGRSEERARIAQDLHDDIGARLLTLMYKAQSPEMEDYVRHTLQDLKTLTRGLAASNHRLSHAAAEWKADLTQRLSVAHVELVWTMSFDEDAMLSVVQWSGLTRVLRELVSNAIAHSQATRLQVEFSLADDQLDLVVSDNGVGRDPGGWAHGLGLGGVRKRVKQLGGEVQWVEVEPRGIACRVRIRKLSRRR